MREPDEIAGAGRAERGAREQPLEVLHALDGVAKLAAIRGQKRQLLDRVQSIADRFERHQRAQQPRSHQAAADGRHRAIDFVEERSVAVAVRALDDFEMFERGGIDEQRVGAGPVGDGAHVREVDLLCRPQMMDEGAGSGDSRLVAVQAESLESTCLELRQQRPARRFRLEHPLVDARERDAVCDDGVRQGRAGGNDQLPGLEHGDFVGERLQAVGAVVFRRRELARWTDRAAPRRRARFWPDPVSGAIAIRNAGSRASRKPASVSVPGETTRTTSRLTRPLAFRGSST